MNKSLLLAATFGVALVAALAYAAPQGASAELDRASVMDRAAAYAMASQS